MTRREKRKRDHIPLSELLASALADRLPSAQRDELREAKVPAKRIISLFTPDHVILHALGGVDRWFNITMTRRGPELKAKDNRDTSIVAKSDRLVMSEAKHLHALATKQMLQVEGAPQPAMVGARPKRGGDAYWQKKRELQSRWPKGRKVRGGNSFQRRQPCK